MAYDEKLAERIRAVLKRRRGVSEKKMFGGLCFLVNGNMCCGVEKYRLVLRVGPERHSEILRRKNARPMDFTGRPLKGFVYVSRAGFDTKAKLENWIEPALDFARSLPKK